MIRKFLAFDLGIANDIPQNQEKDFDWHTISPLGITVAATAWNMQEGVAAHYGRAVDWETKKTIAKERMSQSDAVNLVDFLKGMVAQGFTILTWNGLGFDFDVLAIESGLRKECAELALHHVDMMFHVFCVKGFPVGLDNAAKAMKTSRKTEGVHGDMAPKMWKDGKYNEVIEYVSQDVRATLDLCIACEKSRILQWVTRRGTIGMVPIVNGFLTVEQALALPVPDQSWMDNPWPREKFIAWTKNESQH